MAITTYSELQTSMANFLNRSDLTSVIPDFIAMCEARMWRDLRHWRMETRSSATFDGQYEDLPADWLQTIRLVLQNKAELELASVSEIADKRARTENTTGQPRLYCVNAQQIELYPTPDGSYTGELIYYARPDALSASNASNWVLAYAPDLYLYGSLIHSAPYLSDDERIAVWAAYYESAMRDLNDEGAAAKYSGSGLRLRRRQL